MQFHIEEDLDVVPSLGDPALYLKVSDGKLEGVMRVYADGNLNVSIKKSRHTPLKALGRMTQSRKVTVTFSFF